MDLSNIVIRSNRLKQVSISEVYTEVINREFTSEITTYMTPQPMAALWKMRTNRLTAQTLSWT
jgi:hypothetical protein